ncbi:MAG: patatin-like phospholipase family protein [candidate division Zixibacteria bacterium]|nr:patatin-like phospholipase family protein [candidate division Zixibacteria bacterium]
MVLAEIEHRTGKHVSELFDLIAGTSTGGIIALALTVPDETGAPRYQAQDLVALYAEKGERIFSRSIWHTIEAVGNIKGVKYTCEGIETVLEDVFGETRLKDALTDVIVTSYDIERQEPFLFKSIKAGRDTRHDFLMRHAARSTSAAPTFFEPHKLETEDSGQYRALIDGLVFASNPALVGFVEAKNKYPAHNSFLVASLGTGAAPGRIIYDDVRHWGVMQWTEPLLDIVLNGINAAVDYQMKQLLPPQDDGTRYFRFQAHLDSVNEPMDNVESSNIRTLRLIAEEMIGNNDSALKSLCDHLLK